MKFHIQTDKFYEIFTGSDHIISNACFMIMDPSVWSDTSRNVIIVLLNQLRTLILYLDQYPAILHWPGPYFIHGKILVF